MKVFRKELFYSDEFKKKYPSKVGIKWAEKIDGKEVYACSWLPDAYEVDNYLICPDWCEEVEDETN